MWDNTQWIASHYKYRSGDFYFIYLWYTWGPATKFGQEKSHEDVFCCGFALNYFNPIFQSYYTDTGKMISLVQCQWNIPRGYEHTNQSGTKPNLVAKIWLPTLVTICKGLPKLVANISFHIHHFVNTGLAVGSLVKWLPISVATPTY